MAQDPVEMPGWVEGHATNSDIHEIIRLPSTTNQFLGGPKYANYSLSSTPTTVETRPKARTSTSTIYPTTSVSRRENRASSFMKRIASRFSQGLSTAQTKSIYLQLLFAAVVCICLLWTIWLILLNLSPNYIINHIMATQSFDNGSFWLFVDPSAATLWLAVCGQSAVALGYVVILVEMSICPKRVWQAPLSSRPSMRDEVKKAGNGVVASQRSRTLISSFSGRIASITELDKTTKQLSKIWLKIYDLAFETVLLIRILESGSPTVIVVIFAVVVVMNALAFTGLMFFQSQRIGLVETLIDLLFDMFIAVGWPMLVLVYCLSTFNFPRNKLAINFEIFPPGWFEHQASVIADPVQTAVIYKSLKSLRITSVLDFFARMGVHATLFLRLRQLVVLIQDPRKQRERVYPRRNRGAAALFVIFAFALLVFVGQSLRTSDIACRTHPECVVYAHRWTFLESESLTQCPCLMLIDRDIAPQTYAEWKQPKNVTEKVAQLASSGDLQTLQLTNRYLAVLPEELRHCTEMRHLSLEYTHTQTLPEWIKGYTKLEFLHIESKYSSPVVTLPQDMFDDMAALTLIHFSTFTQLKRLPSFRGLTSLKSLTLALFLGLEELPSFDNLHNLEQMMLSGQVVIDSLPDLAPLKNLRSLVIPDRGTWCCNGFLGECNLQDPMCGVHPVWGTPAATCLPPNRATATVATFEVLARFHETTCFALLQPGVLELDPTQATMDPCNGTLYRQCQDPTGVESMCYNARFMGISCHTNPFPIAMRRRQIELGVDGPCNPEYEAWLGCR